MNAHSIGIEDRKHEHKVLNAEEYAAYCAELEAALLLARQDILDAEWELIRKRKAQERW